MAKSRLRSEKAIRKRLRELQRILKEQDTESDKDCIEGVIAEVSWILGD